MTNEVQQPRADEAAPIKVRVLSVDLPDDVAAAARQDLAKVGPQFAQIDPHEARLESVQVEGSARVEINGAETVVPLYICTSNSSVENLPLDESTVHVFVEHDGTEKSGLDGDTMDAVEDALREHPEVRRAFAAVENVRDERVDEIARYEQFSKLIDDLSDGVADLYDDRAALAAAIAAFDDAAPDRAGEFEAPEPAGIMCVPGNLEEYSPDDLYLMRDDLKDIAEERAVIADVMQEVQDAMRELGNDGHDPTDDF